METIFYFSRLTSNKKVKNNRWIVVTQSKMLVTFVFNAVSISLSPLNLNNVPYKAPLQFQLQIGNS